MKRTITILNFLFLLLGTANAQDFVVSSFGLLPGDLSAKVNPVHDANGVAGALVKVTVASQDVEFTGTILSVGEYSDGTWPVYIPSGTKNLTVTVKGYMSRTVDFPIAIESFRTYELRITLPSKERTKALIMPVISVGASSKTPHMSYGIMVGAVKKFGGYVKAKTDFVFDLATVGECDAYGNIGNSAGWLTGDSKKSRWAVTGGGMMRLAAPLYIYLGAGYGTRVLAWQDYAGEYYRVKTSSFTGIEAETGLIVKLGPVSFSAGVQTNQFKYMEINAGLGVMF